jgi:ATP-dependent RNA helicase DDX46/PRP5
VPAKPLAAINRTALAGLGLKGLPVKPEALKKSAPAAAMDDYTESKRKLEKLGDMPAVDMTMHEGGESVGENLEAADDDDDVVLEKQVVQKMDVDVDEEDEDPLDAFMSGISHEVVKVDGGAASGVRLGARVDDNPDDEGSEDEQPKQTDEIDTAGLTTEEILA